VNKVVFLILLAVVLSVGCGQPDYQDSGPSGADNRTELEVSISALKPAAVEIVRSGLRDESPLIRTNAIEVVSSSSSTDLMPIVVKLLKDESVPVRFAAALAVGDVQYHPAESAVKRLLQDEDENVKIAAAYALTKMGRRGYSYLISRAIRSKDQTVRANAAVLLGELGNKKALPLLYWAMRDPGSDQQVPHRCAEAIAMLGDEKIYPKLWTLLISKFMDDRIDGVRAMAELGTLEARNALLAVLNLAAERLGALGEPGAEPEVLEFLNKPGYKADKKVRERRNALAALAIGRIGAHALTKSLPRLLKSESKVVRLAAAQSVLILLK
jgi:HEAT repeat protein